MLLLLLLPFLFLLYFYLIIQAKLYFLVTNHSSQGQAGPKLQELLVRSNSFITTMKPVTEKRIRENKGGEGRDR